MMMLILQYRKYLCCSIENASFLKLILDFLKHWNITCYLWLDLKKIKISKLKWGHNSGIQKEKLTSREETRKKDVFNFSRTWVSAVFT